MAALRNKIDTCDIVTSSRQLALDKSELKVHIYPQPADRSLFIAVENTAVTKLKINILNLLGSVIEEYDLRTHNGSAKLVINTAELNSGTYFLQLLESGKTRSNARIVVMH